MAIVDIICSKMVSLFLAVYIFLSLSANLIQVNRTLLDHLSSGQGQQTMDIKMVTDSRAATALSRSCEQSIVIRDDDVVYAVILCM